MAVEGLFKIEVIGRPISMDHVRRFRQLLTSKVLMIDPAARSDQVRFAQITVILTWEGIPISFGYSQQLIHILKENMGKYFVAWQFTFDIKFSESGV